AAPTLPGADRSLASARKPWYPRESPVTEETVQAQTVRAGAFESARHFYPRGLNAHIHPLVRLFMTLGNVRIAERYCHLHPEVEPAAARALLASVPPHVRRGGAVLFCATSERGHRRIVVIETNSSP